jgi:hypothetical protein
MRVVILALLVAAAIVAPARSGWAPAGTGTGKAKAKTMPTAAPAAPTASVSSSDVTVSWTASTFPGGGTVPRSQIRRYNTLDNLQTVGAACSGSVSGVTCVEHSVPVGTWTYTVQPVLGTWAGIESPKSNTVIVTL